MVEEVDSSFIGLRRRTRWELVIKNFHDLWRLTDSADLDRFLLGLGILTRCIAFVFFNGQAVDHHITIVEYLVRHKAFPSIYVDELAFHPPLYYLLAAPIFALTGSPKDVQFLSLVISIATLLVLYLAICRTELIADSRGRLYALLLACFLPQFVKYGLSISNDSLCFFFGALAVLQIQRYLCSPQWKQWSLLAVVTGLGLLTKGTFLAFLPVFTVLVLFVTYRVSGSRLKSVAAAAAFLGLSGLLGCYKYVDNYVRYGNASISDLDLPASNWVNEQKESYRGLSSFADLNLGRFIASPGVNNVTESSFPLLLYGTFWYEESAYPTGERKPYTYIGSAIYLVALVPSAAFALGVAKLARRFPAFIAGLDLNKPEHRGILGTCTAGALLAANFAMIEVVLIKYPVWSLMQGRLLFPSFLGFLAVLAAGLTFVDRIAYRAAFVRFSMFALVGLFVMNLSSETGYAVLAHHPSIASLLNRLI